jgi:hypothetical protein
MRRWGGVGQVFGLCEMPAGEMGVRAVEMASWVSWVLLCGQRRQNSLRACSREPAESAAQECSRRRHAFDFAACPCRLSR